MKLIRNRDRICLRNATALSYHAQLGVMNYVTAKAMGVAAITLPSETIFSSELKVTKVWGSPLSVSSGGLAMDADRLISLVKDLDAGKDKPVQFMLASGMNSSALEYSVPEQLFSTSENPAEGISAVKALQIANDQGIPIYRINQSNIDNILPQLQLDNRTIADIQNAVNAGKEVSVSKTDIILNGWTGCGYIIIDPTTGAGAYMISGGMNGSEMQVDNKYWSVFDTLFGLLDLQNSILSQLVKSEIFEIITKKMGLFGVLIEFVTDANQILATASEDSIKKWASMFVVLSKSMVAAMAVCLPLGIKGGAFLQIIVYNTSMTMITFFLNMIQELSLEAIREA